MLLLSLQTLAKRVSLRSEQGPFDESCTGYCQERTMSIYSRANFHARGFGPTLGMLKIIRWSAPLQLRVAEGARHRLLSAVQSRNKTSGLGHLADNELRRSERSARLPCKLIQSISAIEPLTPERVIPKTAWHQLDATRGKDCPTTADRQTCSRYHIARDQPFGRFLESSSVSDGQSFTHQRQ